MKRLKVMLIPAIIAGTALLARDAGAVPSFARQTGMSCAVCHTAYPELTPFGRQFKLNGYLLGTKEKVSEKDKSEKVKLEITEVPGLSAMLMATETLVKNPEMPTGTAADGDKHGIVAFPEQLSLFYAGEIAPKMGAFVQITYDPAAGGIGIDNTDVRWVDHYTLGSNDLTLGIDANKNPTVQDVWNTTPAWGFPFAGSAATPGPAAGPVIGALGQTVGGLGAYLYCDDLVYAELSGYRSVPQGGPADPVIANFAPYWRVALQHEMDKHSVEVGTFGYAQKTRPASAAAVDAPDQTQDVGVDGQYQYIGDDHILTAQASWTKETNKWMVSHDGGVGIDGENQYAPTVENATGSLTNLKINGTYYFDRTIGLTVGYFTLTGPEDAGLYAANTTMKPDSNGYVVEVNYLPWRNTKFTAQYTAYGKFDGSAKGYDAPDALRNAADNQTLMLMAWLMF